MSLRSRLKLLCASAALMGCAGCLVVPTSEKTSSVSGARANLNHSMTNLFVPGRDSIEDVMLKLGEPDLVSADERSLIYRSQKTGAMVIFLSPGPVGGGGAEVTKDFYLRVDLDEQGKVAKQELSSTQLGKRTLMPHDLSVSSGTHGWGKIKSEMIRHNALAVWFAGAEIPHGKNLPNAEQVQPGQLFLTDKALYLFRDGALLNSQPLLTLGIDEMTRCEFRKARGTSQFTIQTLKKQPHSFGVLGFVVPKESGMWFSDNKATKSFADLLSEKLKHENKAD
jgi:hypothetical protein